jgi:hypothetical protein
MSEGSSRPTTPTLPPAEAAWKAPDRRRVLQLTLAGLWLLDALLQLQPFMFSRSFGLLMLGPTALGNPGVIAHPITDVSRSIAQHSVGANTGFVLIQLLLAFGIAYRPTVRWALAGSVVWSLLVWWFGEGLGGLLAGSASPLTGAPGSVLLYGALAVLLWPPSGGEREAGAFAAAGRVGTRAARAVWVVMWGVLAVTAAAGSVARRPASLLRAMAAGEPGWLGGLERWSARLVAGHGPLVAVLLCVALAAIAAAVLLPGPPRRALVVSAVVLGLIVFVVGTAFGQLFSGSSTDPSTGPLLALVALAYWPARLPDRAGSPTWPEPSA